MKLLKNATMGYITIENVYALINYLDLNINVFNIYKSKKICDDDWYYISVKNEVPYAYKLKIERLLNMYFDNIRGYFRINKVIDI